MVDLLTRSNTIAKEFKQGIRSYNSALSFTSTNVDLDKRYANEKHGAYAFCVHKSAHHLMSPELTPNPNNAIQQLNGIDNIQIIFRTESDTNIRRYNPPTADEIGVLIVGGEDESSIQSCNRDIVLCLRGDCCIKGPSKVSH